MLTMGSIPYSNINNSWAVGNYWFRVRLAQDWLLLPLRADEFAACSASGEIVLNFFTLDRIISLYGGAGLAKSVLQHGGSPCPKKRSVSGWIATFYLVLIYRFGMLLTNSDYSPFSLEVRFNTRLRPNRLS